MSEDAELPSEEGDESDNPPPPPAGFEIPPIPTGFLLESDDPNDDGAESDSPPPPEGFDQPPPPPEGFDLLSGESDSFLADDQESSSSQQLPNEESTDESTIDSLAESLSLLSGSWDDENPNNEAEVSWPEPNTEDSPAASELDDAIASFDLVSETTNQQIAESAPSKPSPFLRSSSEVDSIPGDKLHATLNEVESAVLNPDGSIRKQSIDGELILKNTSKKHRAWDIEIHLDSIESTDFGDKISTVKELDPTEDKVIQYTASGSKMLILRETIDTDPSNGKEPSLSLVHSDRPQEIGLNIEVENASPVPLFDVEVSRSIPQSFQITDDRFFTSDGESIVWEIGRLNVGERKNLSLPVEISVDSVEKIKAGVAEATYSAESTVSRARFDRVRASGRQFSYVNAIEDDRPGVWHCTCVFENKSSFVVDLSGAIVRLVGREEPILEVADIRQDVPPEGRWDSISKRVESDDQQSFTQEIRFSILPRVSVKSSGKVELKEQQLTILEAILQKRYDKSRIKSYMPSEIEAVITLENSGSSPINVIRMLDDIPGIFETPASDSVSIEVDGVELAEDQYRVEVVNGTQIEEVHVSPDNKGHGLRIAVGTSAPLGLQPGKTLIVRYPLFAPDPSPKNKILAAPIRVDFSSDRFGPVATREVEKPPMVKVEHKRRNISTGKEVFPGGLSGQYEIRLMFHNNSDSALEDLAMNDIVPGTFSIEGSSVRSDKEGEREASISKESARDGTQVTWDIGRIQQDERIEVLYTIQGDPEAEYKVTDAQDFHGATFGEEVDEEPNMPEWLEREVPEVKNPIVEEEFVETEPDLGTVPESSPLDPFEDIRTEIDEDKGEESGVGGAVEETHNHEHPEEDEARPCPACGGEVGIGTSSCPLCGFTFKP